MFKRLIRKIKCSLMSDMEYANYIGVNIGSNCHIHTRNFSSEPYLITLGDNVWINKDVCFFTHDGIVPFREEGSDLDTFGKIVIGNKVRIAHGAYIMPGVRIGNNCIVGAGAVVTKSLPDGVVVAGNPAKVVSYTSDFLARASKSNFKTKGLTSYEKKEFLMANIDDSKFITKKDIAS